LSDAGFRGDVSAEEAWKALSADPDSVLVDVRTMAEWHYVGVPSLDDVGKTPVFVEWQTFPGGEQATDFVDLLGQELAARGVGTDAPIYFLCRSGSRSRAAAMAAGAAGYVNCFNIGPGFEGPLDENRHRNAIAGWRAAGLPWSQT